MKQPTRPNGTKPQSPPKRHSIVKDVVDIHLAVPDKKTAEELAKIHILQTLDRLERRVECLECANRNIAEQFMNLHRFAQELAKHVGLKPEKMPDIPEAC